MFSGDIYRFFRKYRNRRLSRCIKVVWNLFSKLHSIALQSQIILCLNEILEAIHIITIEALIQSQFEIIVEILLQLMKQNLHKIIYHTLYHIIMLD